MISHVGHIPRVILTDWHVDKDECRLQAISGSFAETISLPHVSRKYTGIFVNKNDIVITATHLLINIMHKTHFFIITNCYYNY